MSLVFFYAFNKRFRQFSTKKRPPEAPLNLNGQSQRSCCMQGKSVIHALGQVSPRDKGAVESLSINNECE